MIIYIFQEINRFTFIQCVSEVQKINLPISIGVGNSHDLIIIYNEGRIKAKRIISHPSFNGETFENDIAIIELEEPLEFSETVLPGCLDTESARQNYGDIIATGFGLTSKLVIDPLTGRLVYTPSVSRFLKEVDYKDVSETEERCQDFKSNICVDSKSPGTEESVCLGDSGKSCS